MTRESRLDKYGVVGNPIAHSKSPEIHRLFAEQTRQQLSYEKLLAPLDGFEDFMISELSGGMKKRAALARALALDPAILFFDEPSAGLDPITSVELDELIVQLNQSLGTTIVAVSHELASIFTIADRCILLDGESKRIIAEGAPRELRDHSQDPRVHAFFNRETGHRGHGRRPPA